MVVYALIQLLGLYLCLCYKHMLIVITTLHDLQEDLYIIIREDVWKPLNTKRL